MLETGPNPHGMRREGHTPPCRLPNLVLHTPIPLPSSQHLAAPLDLRAAVSGSNPGILSRFAHLAFLSRLS